MQTQFRVGISPDFYSDATGMFEDVLEEQLGISPGFAPMPPQPGGVATAAALDEFDALISLGLRITAESVRGLERLAVVARWGVGYDMIDVEALTKAGIALCITPDGVRRPVAEAVLSFIFALAKNVFHHDRMVRSGEWRKDLSLGVDLYGKVLGSVGCGNIGAEVLRLGRALGFRRILATDPAITSEQAAKLGVELVDLDTLFRESDFVTVNSPLNYQTRNLIGARQFRLMRPSAFFINTARGPIVNQADLVQALREHWIAGAGIDVFSPEPPAPDDPLLQLDNVILAPHAMAWTANIMRDNGHEACRHALEVMRGEIPGNIVNREVAVDPRFLRKLERFRHPS